ncbi:TIGR02646 family protein [Vibrio sp. Isolate33]|uniref:retron system putative HNH endonuclease n=1 Tax=Vibrio sp. Isolate33 TaxID=2908539 RepID=UPI001EFC478A|nr:retron system putative HNH endonuclease [Vibrio sp. Isolate33]MCG9544797.1 TIGR02646 family protein [Vibrio sp. Isolate33]
MKKINKANEPIELRRYRSSPDAIYDGPGFDTVKKKIRSALLAEQGFICAYCMSAISEDSMKIEHFNCQASHASLQLDYKNLLGCCFGNEGQPGKQQTCDTKKGSQTLKYSPSSTLHIENLVEYKSTGKIVSSDADFLTQIESVLNLNQKWLVRNRKAALEGIREELSRRRGTRTQVEIRSLLTRYNTVNQEGRLDPYSGVVVQYLKKKMSKLT